MLIKANNCLATLLSNSIVSFGMIGRLPNFSKFSGQNSLAYRRMLADDCLVMRNLFIQVKDTPNPNFMKFSPTGKVVMENGRRDSQQAHLTSRQPGSHSDRRSPKLCLPLTELLECSTVRTTSLLVSKTKWNGMTSSRRSTRRSNSSMLLESLSSLKSKHLVETMSKTLTRRQLHSSKRFWRPASVLRSKTTVETLSSWISKKKLAKWVSHSRGLAPTAQALVGISWTLPGVTLKNGIERMLVYYVAEVKSVKAVDFSQV